MSEERAVYLTGTEILKRCEDAGPVINAELEARLEKQREIIRAQMENIRKTVEDFYAAELLSRPMP